MRHQSFWCVSWNNKMLNTLVRERGGITQPLIIWKNLVWWFLNYQKMLKENLTFSTRYLIATCMLIWKERCSPWVEEGFPWSPQELISTVLDGKISAKTDSGDIGCPSTQVAVQPIFRHSIWHRGCLVLGFASRNKKIIKKKYIWVLFETNPHNWDEQKDRMLRISKEFCQVLFILFAFLLLCTGLVWQNDEKNLRF